MMMLTTNYTLFPLKSNGLRLYIFKSVKFLNTYIDLLRNHFTFTGSKTMQMQSNEMELMLLIPLIQC